MINLVTASFDGIVSDQAHAVFAVGEEDMLLSESILSLVVGTGLFSALLVRRNAPLYFVSRIDGNRTQRSTALDSRCCM